MLIIIQKSEQNKIYEKFWSKSFPIISVSLPITSDFLNESLAICKNHNQKKFLIIEKNTLIHDNENYETEINNLLDHYHFVHGFWNIYYFNKYISNYYQWMLSRNKKPEFGNYDGQYNGFSRKDSYLGKETHLLSSSLTKEKEFGKIYALQKSLILNPEFSFDNLKLNHSIKQTCTSDIAIHLI